MNIRVASKRFNTVQILGEIAFDIEPGSAVALLGASGVGKTTLLRIIAGLDVDFTGNISVPARLGMVFQEPRLLPWYTALRNVELATDITSERAQMFLERVDVAEAADHYPNQLSLGMARRVSLARALSVEPELLILDEPFASLDEDSAAAMRKLIVVTIETMKMTVLLVTHDPEEAVGIADRVLVLSGRPATIAADVPISKPRCERDARLLKSTSSKIRKILAGSGARP
jgi:NitT/TauT family transport system ATP-binding protein